MKKVILASNNQKKVSEIKEILKGIEVKSLKDENIDIYVVEDGKTFEENSKKIATEIAEYLRENGEKEFVVMADDSGLEIDYLDGAPGIYSARFMGEDTSYDIKNKALIDKLAGVPDEKRTARFVCAIACALPDGQILESRGTMEGIIGYEIKGENGFGYDPIFYLPECGCTSAEISPEKKNELSHRGKALRAMKEKLEKYL